MRITILCLLAFAPLFAAEFSDDPSIIAIRQTIVDAQQKAAEALVAKAKSLRLQPIKPMVLSPDPKQSEAAQTENITQYNLALIEMEREIARFTKWQSQVHHSDIPAFCQVVDRVLDWRAKAGVPVKAEKAAPKDAPVNEAKLSEPAK